MGLSIDNKVMDESVYNKSLWLINFGQKIRKIEMVRLKVLNVHTKLILLPPKLYTVCFKNETKPTVEITDLTFRKTNIYF